MNPSTPSPVPVLTSTIEVRREYSTSAAPPQQQHRDAPEPPPFRAPDAFANSATAAAAADPLLAGLQLAQERLAYHLAHSRVHVDVTTTTAAAPYAADPNTSSSSIYHGGAVTSLLVPAAASAPPPLRRDVVDAAEAADARAMYAGENGQRLRLGGTAQGAAGATDASDDRDSSDGDHKHRKKRRHHHKKKEEERPPRHVSRRSREHARRIDAAMTSAAVFQVHERMPGLSNSNRPANTDTKENNAVVGDGTSSDSDRSEDDPVFVQNTKEEAQDGQRKEHRHRRRKQQQQQQQQQSSAHRQLPAADLDSHLRDLPPAGNDALRREIKEEKECRNDDQTRTPASFPSRRDGQNSVHVDGERHPEEEDSEGSDEDGYQPDAEGAADRLAERMRLLQNGDGSDADVHFANAYDTLVRPAEPFHCGPVPVWMQRYSDLLLFDAHQLDSSDAATLRHLRSSSVVNGNDYDVVGREVHVQLPVDAVVLRLRGDIARVRRLRDAIQRDKKFGLGVVCPDTEMRRYEVYDPAEPDWRPSAPSSHLDGGADGPIRVAAAEVEMQATVPQPAPQKQDEVNAPRDNSGGTDANITEAAVVVVDDNTANAAAQRREIASSPSRPRSRLMLSRALESKDLQRPVLAQTIPPWRRRGAALKFLDELLTFLEDRLYAFGKQLDDPVQGAALELIGAPDSAGVDGSVQTTYPPALERALRTTITNTLLSDIFATSRTALGNRALRISEALRRRQTPLIHDVYVTEVGCRPVYDYTKIQSARRMVGYGGGSSSGSSGISDNGRALAAGAAAGVDTRKSYSIHVDYVRFQPSLEGSGAGVLQAGPLATAAAASETSANANASSRRSTLLHLSSSEEPFSSLLLGSYISVFFPNERADSNSSSGDTQRPQQHNQQQQGNAAAAMSGPRNSLGTDNVDGTTAALLLALSTATRQNPLVTFTPEEYLVSLLLQYYEQYRLLQLNLLPSLKNRFFYREQLAQLERQTARTPELSRLQARLETLAETSANVERGCLHVMILLWNAVLEQRRRQRDARSGGDGEGEEMGERVEVDPPIIVESRSRPQKSRKEGHRHRSGSTAAPPTTTTTTIPEERRSHPPLFIDDVTSSQQQQQLTDARSPVVHSVNNTVMYTDREQADAAGTAGGSTTPHSPPVPLFFSPSSPDMYDAGAQASPLLAPAASVSTNATTTTTATIGTTSGSGNGGVDVGDAVNAADPLAWSPPPTRFRFFLRRYGTVDEVPYRMGDDLLWYAAEVEGTDVIPTLTSPQTQAAAAAKQKKKKKEKQIGEGALQAAKAAALPAVFQSSSVDELLYFQLVVFTRSHAAMVPQYVGCTTPRPMTTAKVIFFNETFEVRALHEPAELLLHLIPVTSGPSKTTVMSTVRLKPTLTRRYALLPLQPPTAFMFHGRLFSRNHNTVPTATAASGSARALSATPLNGVLAVSTTWTSSQGLTIAQMESVFLRGVGASGGGGVGLGADPLDPQYAPLLRALRNYYLEVDAQRAAAAASSNSANANNNGGPGNKSGGRSYSRGRRGAAVREPLHAGVRGRSAHVAASTAMGEGAARRTSSSGGRHLSDASRPVLGRHASLLALQRQRHATASLQRQLTTLCPSALFNAAATRLSFRVPGSSGGGGAASGGSGLGGEVSASTTPGAAAGGGLGAGANVYFNVEGHNALNAPAHATPMMVAAAAAGAHDLAVEEVQMRLPTVRLQHLFRRWLIKIGRIKAADEVESRLYERPIPLEDADTYLARKAVLRLVEKEEEARNKEYSASGATFDSERYYKAPSSISGLALSNLPRETKLKLWQERQRRLLLTLKASRNVPDAEKLESIVKVPKLVMKLVFDFTPRSQLNPHRKERPKTEDIDRALLKRRQDSRIVIHIMKAHNLPFRADGTPLEPFVQASFVSEAAYTRSEVGSNPSWFQTLELPFQPLDFEEDTLGMIDDDVVLSLYDKVEVKMAPSAATTAAVAHETHYRTERRFIGTLRIPFYSLHQASQARMEGVYPLRTPRWVLGYDSVSITGDEPQSQQQQQAMMMMKTNAANGGVVDVAAAAETAFGFGREGNENPLGATEANVSAGNAIPGATAGASKSPANGALLQQNNQPTVQLYLSLWPPLQRDPPKRPSKADLHRSVNALFVSPQLHYLHRVALKWQQTAEKHAKAIAAMNAQATTRQVDPFVRCSTGDMVLVCRYVLPSGGPPPPSVRTVYEAIRYVSLLPFVADMMSFGEKDVWSTNAELLAMRSGDYEELALLLVHFLRYLAPGRPTYAVVGSGSIYQQTIMVLHQFEDKELYLIDPRSGWTVPAGTPYGTLLRDVYMVVSHDQLWANTQLSGLPHRMTWDLHNPTHWLPCFDHARDKRLAACIPHLFPIQREVLDFPLPDTVKSREIEMELRACLKRALLTWRNGCPPAYHRGVEAILRELLEAAEEERCSCGSARRSDITRSAAARLCEYFGEPVTGEPSGDAAGRATERKRRRKTSRKQRRRRGTNAATPNDPAREDGEVEDDDAEAEEMQLRLAADGSMTPSGAAFSSGIRMMGSPVMGSYNPSDPNFEELLQQVYESAVHEVGTNEVSFAAGIYVKSFTGDVCAMWVFLAAICRG